MPPRPLVGHPRQLVIGLLLAALSLALLLPGAPASASSTQAAPVAGVFRGSAPAEIDAFERWAGHDAPYAVDWSARWTWTDIAEPTWMLERWKGTDRRLVLGVAMLPENGQGTMQQGAAGSHNLHFRRLAERLVAAGQADAILRVGWEMNGSWYRWSAHDPDAFVAYWRQIVGTMRAVPGAQFEFDWTVNNGHGQSTDAVRAWPGAAWVDYVGVDAYDQSWAAATYPYPASCDAACRRDRQERAWREDIHGGQRGLGFWAAFARQHGKPLSVPEWGVFDRPDGHGGLDNAVYIERMHEFLTDPANNVAYHAYFEFDAPDGDHRLMTGKFPAAGQAYRRLFGAAPAPTPEPASGAQVTDLRLEAHVSDGVKASFTLSTSAPTTFRYLQVAVRDAQGRQVDAGGRTLDLVHSPDVTVDGSRTFHGTRASLAAGAYTARVAYSLDGVTWAEAAPVARFEVPGSLPTAPIEVQARPLQRAAAVSWRPLPSPVSTAVAVAADGTMTSTSSSALPTRYVVTTFRAGRSVGTVTLDAPATQLTVHDLHHAHEYTFAVQAGHGGPWSPWSVPSSPISPSR